MRLPISRTELGCLTLDGHVEALIAELPLDRPVAAGIAVIEALAERADGEPLAAAELPLTDFEFALAALRRRHLGDQVTSEPTCAACGERNEISFSLDELAASVAAALPANGEAIAAGQGFRLPTAGDVALIEGNGGAPRRLRAACLGTEPPAGRRRGIERAIAGCAPLLSRMIEAPCAHCGAGLEAIFHLPAFIVAELARQATAVFDDVHVLARGYGWREAEILSLPRVRRHHYAARLREAA